MKVIISSSKTPIQTTKYLVMRLSDGSYISGDQFRALGFVDQMKIKTIKRPEMYYEVENSSLNFELPIEKCSSIKPTLQFEGTAKVSVKITDPVAAIEDGIMNIQDDVSLIIMRIAQEVLQRFHVQDANKATSSLREELARACSNLNQDDGFKSYLKVVVGAVLINPDKQSLEFLRKVEEAELKKDAIRTDISANALTATGDAMVKKVAEVVEEHQVQQLVSQTNMLGLGRDVQ